MAHVNPVSVAIRLIFFYGNDSEIIIMEMAFKIIVFDYMQRKLFPG